MDEPSGFSFSFCCTKLSVFCYESCQCNLNYGFWTLQILLTKFLLCLLLLSIHVPSLSNFHQVSVLLDSSRMVSCELLESSDCIPGLFHLRVLVNCIVIRMHVPSGLTIVLVVVFFKKICSFASVVMIAIRRVHSTCFH